MIISLKNYLKIGAEIEKPQHYAAKIKKIDEYFGLLAWSEILLKSENEKNNGECILKELIEVYSQNPEAYLKL